ncbi:MAG: ParA family protein [Candidatus Bipolaricaulota bacterium]|nr:ParA family protein [Candidatus Bipolaricaulota bacterium]
MAAVVYAVANHKGGVGKTTTCASLGAALAEGGKRVLLVDLDPQAGLTAALGFRGQTFPNTTYTLLLNEVDPKDAVLPTPFAGLHLIPADLDLAGAEAELLGEIGWDRTLRNALEPLKPRYDFILLDCPPSLGVLTVNALMAAERAIIPVQTEYLALRSLTHLGEVITKVQKRGNPSLRPKLLRTLHQRRSRHAQEASLELERLFAGRLYRTVITRTVKLAEAARAGVPIVFYLPASEPARQYRDLAQEVLADA